MDGLDEIESFATAFKAGLKHFPDELGLLCLQDSQDQTPWELAYEVFGEDETCRTIEESLSETLEEKIAEVDPDTNLYPFIIAAAAGVTCNLDTPYFLLRKIPVVFDNVVQIEESIGSDKRKRKHSS